MPTKAVSAAVMEVGKKGGGKHWTAPEISARKRAAEDLKREKEKKLKKPDWLTPAAKRVWDKKLKECADVQLLDVLDEESLAVYCDVVIKYKQLSSMGTMEIEDHKVMQAYSRIIAQYADKLGFTPAARARLIKKRAEKKKDPFGDDFD